MSKVSQIYDMLADTMIPAVLPNAKRIPNPYAIEQAPITILANGYAVAFGPATNPELDLSCSYKTVRDFGVILTRQMTATENATTGQATVVKALMEDAYALIKSIEGNVSLNGIATKSAWTADSGPLAVDLERGGNFLQIALTFTVLYDEALS
jgi:hypothetical protein